MHESHDKIILNCKAARRRTLLFKAHPQQRTRASIPFSFVLLLLAGLVLRFILGAEFFGYKNDISSFMAWSDQAYRSFSHIYDSGMFLDYPPGYVYVLTLIGAVRNLLGISWDTHTGLLLLKLVPILADAATSVIIYRMSSKSFSKWASIGLSSAYLFNPATLLNSAVWGQVDAFFMLFIFGYLYLLTQGKLSKSAAMLAIALLIKPQALLFGPFLLIRLIQRKSLKASLSTVSSGIGAFILGALPFCIGNGFMWLPKLYFNTLSSYPYASLNAFNVMTLFRGNWVPTTDGVYGAFGTLALAAIFLYAWYLYDRSVEQPEAAYVISFLFLAAVITFSAKMHERYLFYA
jgi:dolichyl-phosphate-mannose-protein mannosyltransferase